MKEKIVEMETEVSIRLDRLVYIILRSWRRILKASLLAALLGAVLVSTVNVINFNSEEHRAKTERKYQMELFSHELEGENLEMDIQNLYESIKQQENYNANSLLMQIDPYNKYVATMIYYVDTDYQIMPEYQYQNIDYGPRLVQMYAEYLSGGEMYSEISERLSEPHDVRFIEELFEISAHHSMGMLEIQVCAVSQEMCQELMDIISEGIKAKHTEATQMIGDHTLTELNKNISSVVDTHLDTIQKENIQSVTDATTRLTEKQEALEEWDERAVPEDPCSAKSIMKTLLKAACIGAFLGVFISMAFGTVFYITGDRIVGIPEFQDRCTLNVLGAFPETAKNKGRLDQWIDRIGQVTLYSTDVAMLATVIAENICMVANGNNKQIALIGSIPSEELECIASALQNGIGSKMKFLAAGNPLTCAYTANLVNQSDAVVLVEKQGVSTYTNVLNQCQRMNLWGVNVLGIVFTKVDSIAR